MNWQYYPELDEGKGAHFNNLEERLFLAKTLVKFRLKPIWNCNFHIGLKPDAVDNHNTLNIK